jgi:hypothetical protein
VRVCGWVPSWSWRLVFTPRKIHRGYNLVCQGAGWAQVTCFQCPIEIFPQSLKPPLPSAFSETSPHTVRRCFLAHNHRLTVPIAQTVTPLHAPHRRSIAHRLRVSKETPRNVASSTCQAPSEQSASTSVTDTYADPSDEC